MKTKLSMYRRLREEGMGRPRAWLLAIGWWCQWPFSLLFPDDDDALPPWRVK